MGQSPQIGAIRRQIERIGQFPQSCSLLGESGTGKEVVARALHNANPRGAFIPIDCGSLVGPLMESELFGHVKGAFTGASENKRGLIELANGGTAFFDEIGDLPARYAGETLRLLQEKEYRPWGRCTGRKWRSASSPQRIANLARGSGPWHVPPGSVLPAECHHLRMPALRDRKEDISHVRWNASWPASAITQYPPRSWMH